MEHQPRPGGDELPPTPEQREHLRINTIVIPADEDEPLRQGTVSIADVQDYQQIVGGYIEAISLDDPSSTLYCNEEGKQAGLRMNPRATLLLWAHQPSFRFFDYVAGDALLTGPIDEHGDDTDVPHALVQTLFQVTRFRTEVQTRGDPGWYGNDLRFDGWADAYGHVLNLARNWALVEDVRVLPDE